MSGKETIKAGVDHGLLNDKLDGLEKVFCVE